MMRKRFQNKYAQSAIEYMFLVTLILFTLLIFQKYISRGFSGRWQAAGDSFGHGRQFDPNSTIECAYDFNFTNSWYDINCYEASACDLDCKSEVYFDLSTCQSCISGCSVPQCF